MKNKNEVVGHYSTDIADVFDDMQRNMQENINKDYGTLDATLDSSTKPIHLLDMDESPTEVIEALLKKQDYEFTPRIELGPMPDIETKNSDTLNVMIKKIEVNGNEVITMYPNRVEPLHGSGFEHVPYLVYPYEDLHVSTSGKSFMAVTRNSGRRACDIAMHMYSGRCGVGDLLDIPRIIGEGAESIYGKFDIMYDELGYLNRRHYKPLMRFETSNVFLRPRDLFKVLQPYETKLDILRNSYKLVDMEEEVFGNVIPKHRLDIETIRMMFDGRFDHDGDTAFPNKYSLDNVACMEKKWVLENRNVRRVNKVL